MLRAGRLFVHLITQKNMFCRRGQRRGTRDGNKNTTLRFILFLFCILNSAFLISQNSCGCDEKKLTFSSSYSASHKLIFRGKTLSISTGEDYSKVTFVVTQLFNGKCAKEVDVYFDKKAACQLKFNTGEDWLIYANYKQIEKPFVEYCSRSRKNVIITNKNVEVQYIKSDLTVDAECEQLHQQFGNQNISTQVKEENNFHNNIIPGFGQRIVLILCSIAGFMLIYFAVNKLLKR